MAQNKLNPKYNPKTSKICRTLGVNLWGQSNNAFLRKNYKPGQHGMMSSKPSDYGIQLNAKQKLKFYYGKVSEKQLVNYYKEAIRLKGDSAENLVGLLERRLDALVYRSGFAKTVFSAAQMVSHGHVRVNGKKVNIRSYQVKPGDVIEFSDAIKENAHFIENAKQRENDGHSVEYLSMDFHERKISFVRIPKIAEIPYASKMEIHLVIEFYSR